MSKSNISFKITKRPQDQQTTLIRGLSNQTYECMICYDYITCKQSIWSCKTCHHTFHLECAHKWTKSCASVENNSLWRCPACQANYDTFVLEYRCFCGKILNPAVTKYGIPHSCGQPCAKERACPHKCSDPCHPGPCKPCERMTMPTPCFCSKESFVVKCSSSTMLQQISCGKPCKKILNCGVHQCEWECHESMCGPCTKISTISCNCGTEFKQVKCGEAKSFQCGKKCNVKYSCGIHQCESICHDHKLINGAAEECPLDPKKILYCECGQTTLISMGKPRKSCTDDIPTCLKECNKPLVCGHFCMKKCHSGKCPECSEIVKENCRCGRKTINTICSSVTKNEYGEVLCTEICKKMNMCKRHRCQNRCCKMDFHICEKVCGKVLSCGLHACMLQCGHPDRCHDCVEGVSFDELSCACGRTKIYPPIPCNTRPVECTYPCRRPLSCNHRSFGTHNCHPDNQPCPPCMSFISKACYCGNFTRTDFPCSRSGGISCGNPCSEIYISCGHQCKRFCHDGACDDETCKSTCGRLRSICQHICGYKCHGTKECDEKEPCKIRIPVTCPCGSRKSSIVCGMMKGIPIENRNQKLECDDVCAQIHRNKCLAAALAIEDKPIHIETLYEDELLRYAYKNLDWVREIEKNIQSFIDDKSIMYFYHRQFLNYSANMFLVNLAPYYNLNAELVDLGTSPNVIYRKKSQADVPAPPVTLISQMAIDFDAESEALNIVDEPENSVIEKDLPSNAILFYNMQMGLDATSITSFISTKVNSNIKLVLHSISSEDCAIQFKNESGKYMNPKKFEKMIRNISDECAFKWIDSAHCVKRIELCRVDSENNIQYPKRSQKVIKAKIESTISVQNAFDALELDD